MVLEGAICDARNLAKYWAEICLEISPNMTETSVLKDGTGSSSPKNRQKYSFTQNNWIYYFKIESLTHDF